MRQLWKTGACTILEMVMWRFLRIWLAQALWLVIWQVIRGDTRHYMQKSRMTSQMELEHVPSPADLSYNFFKVMTCNKGVIHGLIRDIWLVVWQVVRLESPCIRGLRGLPSLEGKNKLFVGEKRRRSLAKLKSDRLYRLYKPCGH